MRGNRIRLWRAPAAVLLILFGTFAAQGHTAPTTKAGAKTETDPLAAEVRRWSAFLRTNVSNEEDWLQVKQVTQPVVAAAEQALRDGRRMLALQKLAAARPLLAATVYVQEHTGAERKDTAAFEAEWARMGRVLRSDLGTTPAGSFDGVEPAAVRALAEAALPQVRIFYDASLEYGRSTMPDSGLFYLGSARAQREFAAFCRKLSAPSHRPAPPLRALTQDLDGLENALLSAYVPPAAIDRHSEFIAASAALKEARELDSAGLRYGALVKYLQAALRAAPLLPAPKPLDAATLAERMRELETRLSAGDRDDSIGRIFLESAQADVASVAAGGTPATATAIVSDVLPRYFAALDPTRLEPSRVPPGVTVTLVRWPYT